MNSARTASRLFPLLLTVFWPSQSFATPKKSAPASDPAALSFRLTARVGYAAPGETRVPDQTVAARVWLRGKQARVETQIGGEPSVVLFSPPYIYRLLPAAKAGVQWKLPAQNSAVGAFDPQELLQNPARIRVALLQGGARKIGVGKLGNVPVEIYQAANFRSKGQKATAWLRKSDALPLRFQTSGGSLHLTASWANYQRPKGLSPAFFAPPPGYKVRAATGAPPFSVL